MQGNKYLWIVLAAIVVFLFMRGRDPGPNVGRLPQFQPVTRTLQAEAGSQDLGAFMPSVSIAQPQALTDLTTGLVGASGNVNPGLLGRTLQGAAAMAGIATPMPPIYGADCPIGGGWSDGIAGHDNCWPPDFASWTVEAQIAWLRGN